MEERIVSQGAKRALCVGINDYPYEDNDLKGCINDANAWAEVLTDRFGFPRTDIKILLDGEATKKTIIAEFKNLLAGARSGDILVFTNSSHGSYIADTSGDEEKYDEILCPYDIEDNDIVDDELREIISGMNAGAHLTIVLDNCFSGTATRARLGTPDDRRVRFLNPAVLGRPVLENIWTAKPKSGAGYPESEMREILLSGCSDKEYSYDARFGATNHGAMTYYALEAMRQGDYRLTYRDLHHRLTELIREYPQHPQLEGSDISKDRQLFS